MRFYTWLFKQRFRKDPIGDLALTWIMDKRRLPFNGKYLKEKGAPKWMLNVYHAAKREYRYGKQ